MAYSVETKTPTVSNSIESFDQLIEQARIYAERLSKLHDRIHGPRPPSELVGDEKASDRPQSVISSITLRRSQLAEVLDHIERSISGIESGL